MNKRALQAEKNLSTRKKLQRDFAAFTLEEKRQISAQKLIAERNFKQGLVSLKQMRLTESRENFNLKRREILEEVYKYEKLCIMEAISSQTVGEMQQNAEKLKNSMMELQGILPSVTNLAEDAYKKFDNSFVETADGVAFNVIKLTDSKLRGHLNTMKESLGELVKLYKLCDALHESMTEDSGVIRRDVIMQIQEWLRRSYDEEQIRRALETEELTNLFHDYDSQVKDVTEPVGGVSQKKGIFSKLFSKKTPAKSGGSSTQKRFEMKIAQLVKFHFPGNAALQKGVIEDLLSKPYLQIADALNSFAMKSTEIDEKFILSIAKTGWVDAIKGFLSGSGEGKSGIRLF